MSETGRETIGWREFLRDVNLADFLHMIDGEVRQLGSNLRIAIQAFPKLPWGPLLTVGGFAMVLLRLVLLCIVFLAFGVAIMLISGVRAVTGVFRRS